MIEKNHPSLSVGAQCRLLSISRSSFCYELTGETAMMRLSARLGNRIAGSVGIGRWITFYNHQRPHTGHGGQPPAVVYFDTTETDEQVQAVAQTTRKTVQESGSSLQDRRTAPRDQLPPSVQPRRHTVDNPDEGP